MDIRAPLLGLLCCVFAGCESIDNDRLTVGEIVPPTFIPADQRGSERLVPAPGPSLSVGDRSNWASFAVVVAGDGVQHHPRWTTGQPSYVKTPRSTGLHPTAESALSLDRASGSEAAEAVAGPFHAASDVVMLIPRMFAHCPGVVRLSPSEWYERGSVADRAAAPVLQPSAAPIEAGSPASTPASTPAEAPGS